MSASIAVLSGSEGRLQIEVSSHKGCCGCAQRGGCSGDRKIVLDAASLPRSLRDLPTATRAVVSASNSELLRAAVICYLFPAFLLLAGGVAGSFVLAGARDLGALAGGIVALLLGSFVLRRYDSQSAGLSVRYRAGLLSEQGGSGEP